MSEVPGIKLQDVCQYEDKKKPNQRCEFESHSGEVYSIQHYVIKFVSDLLQVGGFLWMLRFPPPIKLIALNTITPTLNKILHKMFNIYVDCFRSMIYQKDSIVFNMTVDQLMTLPMRIYQG